MPFALLLRDISTTLSAGGIALDPWSRLVAMEELLIDRARSAFLVHWFGRGLPMNGLALRVHVANIAELQAKYDEIQRAQRPEQWGMNLLTPLQGAVGATGGALLGAIVNPAVLITGLVWFIVTPSRDTRSIGAKILSALEQLGLLLLRIILIPVNIPLAIAAGVQHGGRGRTEDTGVHGVPERGLDQILDVFALGAALADMTAALNPFLAQLTGPRTGVRNRLVRAMLLVGDKLSGLVAQLIGFAAILVDRIAPLILPLVDQGIAFILLFGEVRGMLQYLVADLKHGIAAAPLEVRGVVRQITAGLRALIADVFVDLRMLFDYVGTTLSANARNGLSLIQGMLVARIQPIRAWLTDHPVLVTIRMMKPRIDAAGTAFTEIKAAYDAKPSGFFGHAASSVGHTMMDAVTSAYRTYRAHFPSTGPTLPDFPALPSIDTVMNAVGRPRNGLGDVPLAAELADRQVYGIDALSGRWAAAGLPSPATLEAQLAANLDLSSLTDAAAGTAELLQHEARRTNPGRALAAARARDVEFRDSFTLILGRLLPGEARASMGELLGLFRTIDEEIYERAPAHREATSFPTLDLPDNGMLYPRIARVRFHAPEGTSVEAVRAFEERLVARLQGQTYPVPGGP
jgi:hypothetical protein